MSYEIQTMSLAELNAWCESPEGKAEAAFHERLMLEPLGLREKILRPYGGVSASTMDEVEERDVCAAFARDIFGILQCTVPGPGMPLERIKELPECSAVYWLNAPLDGEWKSWRLVYIGKASNLRHRWCDQEHHRLEQAKEWGCRIDWWELPRGIEGLVEAAMIYHLKPSWNERQ